MSAPAPIPRKQWVDEDVEPWLKSPVKQDFIRIDLLSKGISMKELQSYLNTTYPGHHFKCKEHSYWSDGHLPGNCEYPYKVREAVCTVGKTWCEFFKVC